MANLTLSDDNRKTFDWYKDYVAKQPEYITLAFWTQLEWRHIPDGNRLLAFVAFDTDDEQPQEAPHVLAVSTDAEALERLMADLIAELPADRVTTGVICR